MGLISSILSLLFQMKSILEIKKGLASSQNKNVVGDFNNMIISVVNILWKGTGRNKLEEEPSDQWFRFNK
jgi:hypothetical protein